MYVSAGKTNVLLYSRRVNRLRGEFRLSAMVSTLYYYVYKLLGDSECKNESQNDDKSLLRVHLPNELFMRLWLLWISPKLSFYSRALKAGL